MGGAAKAAIARPTEGRRPSRTRENYGESRGGRAKRSGGFRGVIRVRPPGYQLNLAIWRILFIASRAATL